MKVEYTKVNKPKAADNYYPVAISKETMESHIEKVYVQMEQRKLDTLLVYGDREHGSNYAYLTGFETRFEESVLVLHRNRQVYLMLGNENLKMANYSFLKGEVVHVPHFSLPGQPMETKDTLGELFVKAGVRDNTRVGIAGWKMFTSKYDDNEQLFDVPAFIVDAVRGINRNGRTVSVGDLFLGENGVRNIMNANEIAHYEYGAGLASSRVLKVLDAVEIGKTEIELADELIPQGQPTNVTTICATGERFTNAVVFPRNKRVERGDRFSLTLGLRGGLSSRAAYVVGAEKELPEGQEDYLEMVVIPYFRAAVAWLDKIGVGVTCGELYDAVDAVLPKNQYHWSLNPGHLSGQDEWTVSPIKAGSGSELKSGMIIQLDIIPSVSGYGGVSAEDGIVLADEQLRKEIEESYPETWIRMQNRRKYMEEELGIHLKKEILPMSDICGYLRPYLLKKEWAMRVSAEE